MLETNRMDINSEGYRDPTAGKAYENICREERRKEAETLEKQPYLTSDCVACSECLRVINCMDNCMEDAMYCKYCGAKMDKEEAITEGKEESE